MTSAGRRAGLGPRSWGSGIPSTASRLRRCRGRITAPCSVASPGTRSSGSRPACAGACPRGPCAWTGTPWEASAPGSGRRPGRRTGAEARAAPGPSGSTRPATREATGAWRSSPATTGGARRTREGRVARGTGPTACAPPRAPQEGREAAGRRRGGGQGGRAPAAREVRGPHGGQGSALAGSRGRGRRCGAATRPRRGCARCSAPTRRTSPATGSRGRSRCRTPAFARLSREAGRKREGILRSTGLGVPDARVEAVNNKARVATGRGYGSHDIGNLIDLVMPGCSDLRPTLPGGAVVTRSLPTRTHEASFLFAQGTWF